MLKIVREFSREINGEIVRLRHDTNSRLEILEMRITERTNYFALGTSFLALIIAAAALGVQIYRLILDFCRPKPQITLEQIEALIDRKLASRN